jgi:hypothetical protein
MTNTINAHLRVALGIDGIHLTPITYYGWLLEMVRMYGMVGLRYALGIKINRAIDRKRDGGFNFLNEEFEGFRWLVIEILSWNNIHSENLRILLAGEFAWTIRYLKGIVSEPIDSAAPSNPLPPSPWILNKRLAHDLKGAGLHYALRYFTAPIHMLGDSMCERCPHYFRLFVEEIRDGGGVTATNLERALREPEFSCYVHLIDSSDDSDGSGILDINP